MTPTTNQISSFDYQKLYDRLREKGYQGTRDHTSHIRPYVSWIKRNIKYDSVLDIGCGSGGSFRMIGGRYVNVTGAEISANAVAKGRDLGRNIFQSSATDLPFEDDSFDLVVSSDVFEHLHPDDVQLAIDESVRVCRNTIFMKIATMEDQTKRWKKFAGHPLHLTIKPIEWWIKRFRYAGTITWQDSKAFCMNLNEVH